MKPLSNLWKQRNQKQQYSFLQLLDLLAVLLQLEVFQDCVGSGLSLCLSRTMAGRIAAKKAQMSLMLDGEKKATSKYFNCFTLAGSKRLKNGISYQQPQPQSMSICFTLSVSERGYTQPNFTLTTSIVLFQCCHFYFSRRLYNFKIILYIFDLFYFS